MKKLLAFVLIITTILITGCSGGNKKAADQSSDYKIYYVDSKTSSIVSESYKPTGTTKEELVKELLDVIQKGPKNIKYKKVLPDTIGIKDFSFNKDGSLVVNFDTNYTALKGIPEVLCRATIVKTLTQIPGVEYIIFNINGQPLIDSNGQTIGLLTAEDFIESTSAETNYKVTLYFANKAGDKLVQSSTNIFYSGTGSIEERVINQLINGPTEMGMYNTIPPGTTLLNVSTNEGICQVDLNEKFMDALPGVTDEVTIYSIVNSLVELPNIKKVQFLINGEVRDTFRESTPFNGTFERNLAIIEGSK